MGSCVGEREELEGLSVVARSDVRGGRKVRVGKMLI